MSVCFVNVCSCRIKIETRLVFIKRQIRNLNDTYISLNELNCWYEKGTPRLNLMDKSELKDVCFGYA